MPEVDLVISYDVPITKRFGWTDPDYANFMHRVGRTGRYGTDGISLMLMQSEIEEEMMDKIAEYYSGGKNESGKNQFVITELKQFHELKEIFEKLRPNQL